MNVVYCEKLKERFGQIAEVEIKWIERNWHWKS